MTAYAVAAARRRGVCPGLSTPLPTGDGLLVRLLPVGTMPLGGFAALCAAARAHGNGIVEVSARGSIQVRGLRPGSVPPFAATIAALGIAAADGVPVHCNPLAGIDAAEIFDAAALADALRETLLRQGTAARVSAKVSVAIDGGGALNLAALAADIRLRAHRTERGVMLRVAIGGDQLTAADLGSIAPGDGVETIIRLLEVLAGRGRDARARDILAKQGVAVFRDTLSSCLRPSEDTGDAKACSEAIGQHPMRDGSLACGVGLAFGHAEATALENLAEAAAASGAKGLRAAPGRALLAVGIEPKAADAFAATADRLGFIVSPGDPRRRVVACAGAPHCASAHIAARTLAPAIAAQAPPAQRGTATIHVSGCVKGCARAAPAALTVVGTAGGCALIADGSAADAPFAIVSVSDLPAAIVEYSRKQKHESDHV